MESGNLCKWISHGQEGRLKGSVGLSRGVVLYFMSRLEKHSYNISNNKHKVLATFAFHAQWLFVYQPVEARCAWDRFPETDWGEQ